MKPYITIHNEVKSERIINRSRFISQCFPVASEEEALAKLAAVKKEYPDATHVCYAYIIGELGLTARFSDAGEPSGTAGMPILDVLKANGLTNVLCTVTRYFGGILLGTGGLVRAYSGGAAQAVSEAGIDEHIPGTELKIECDYSRYGTIESIIAKAKAVTLNSEFAHNVSLTVSIDEAAADGLIAEITERTDGRCRPIKLGECELVRRR